MEFAYFSGILWGLFQKRNIEQFSQSHNFQQKIFKILTNKRLKLKNTFCVLCYVLFTIF